ncbi:MAG: tol-pal system YbgF family protein [Bacteroidota bacterium]
MAKTKTKEGEGIEILEDPGALVSKAEEFLNSKKNRNLTLVIGSFIALVIAGFFGYRYYISNQDQEAQREMFQAVYYFEADSLGKALNGDGINYGFLQIIEDYPGTKGSNLANFYAGITYLKLGNFENSIRYLKDFNSSDYLLQARAYSLIGDAYLELDDFSSAIASYNDAINYKPNENFTPIYLKKLALAEELQGNYSAAANAYGRIIDEYKESEFFQEAKKQKARLEGLAAN